MVLIHFFLHFFKKGGAKSGKGGTTRDLYVKVFILQ
jgi:hypothetical protein